jgi:aspartyl-tRNA(Asn)/glutamyl-tRNA(Gln) amidotransferase subunit A
LYVHHSITAFLADLKAGSLSCAQVVDHYLTEIDRTSALNAFIEVYRDEARLQALALDEKLSSGKPVGRLCGVVIGLKDVICHQGHLVTAGSDILSGFRSLYSATAVDRLLAEDAIIIGRLNCDEFGMGSSNEHSAYGKVLNPRDETRVPGGSSGGSAAAVAAGLCMVSLGSDTGGSVRQPADFCGVIGLKPGYGRISRYGLIAYASSFDQIGILGTSVEDLALCLEIMAGADGMDATASTIPVPAYSERLRERPSFRIAYSNEALEHPSVDPEIASGIRAFMEKLKEDGHHIEPVKLDFLDHIVPTYYVLTTAEASSNLSRYDGIRYGHRTAAHTDRLEEIYERSRSEGFGKEVKRRIMLGTFVLSTGYFDAYFTKAQQARRRIVEQTREIFREHDILLLPTSPFTAFHFGEKSEDAISMFLADIFTVYANLAGIPGISFPIDKHSNGMPFGVQGLSDRHGETALLQLFKEIVPLNGR